MALATGGTAVGSNQNQIETHILGLPQGGGRRHDFRFPVGEDSAHFTRPDRLVYIFSASLFARRKLSAWSHVLAAKGIIDHCLLSDHR
jgi:hypothetical protein